MPATEPKTTDPDAERVEWMIHQCWTKADLIDLVRMLDNRNMALQRVIRNLTTGAKA